MDLISLLVLLAVLVCAFVFKVNSGLLAIAASLVLARCAGIADKVLIGYFNNSLFLMLLGVMLIFCIAQQNKTLELLTKKILALIRGKVQLFPPLLFLISAVLSAIGPGLISVCALMAVLVAALAKETKTPAIHLIPFAVLGSFAGGLSPITPSGIVAITKAEESNIFGIEMPLMFCMALVNVLYAAILYFFVFKWHRYKKTASPAETAEAEAIPAFTAKQYITLAGIVLVAVLVAVFQINVGLAAFAVAVVLLLLRVADEGASLKMVPWGTLVMITGVGILISLITDLGGIDLLSRALSTLTGPKTASAVMGFLAGVMSWFSSASGVVMPTLIPTVPDMVASFGGSNAVEVVVALCVGAHLAALSPLSSCGGLMLAGYSSSGDVDVKARNKMFLQLFILSACGVLFCALLGLVGFYKLNPMAWFA